MRIIAGEFRGRILLAPTGNQTRPITDRAKQSLFDILAPLIPGARVYDCFAGTGSLGLECLSRGACQVTFVEQHGPTAAILRANIEMLAVRDRSKVVALDVFNWFLQFDIQSAGMASVDLVFLDPPYSFVQDRADDLRRLAWQLGSQHLADGAVAIFRHDPGDDLELPPLVRYDQREYGGMTIEFLRAG